MTIFPQHIRPAFTMRRSICTLVLTAASALTSGVVGAQEPFATGRAEDGLRWKVRFNLPRCRHGGHVRDAWCKEGDATAAAQRSGIEAHLIDWASRAKTQSILMAYFSFSNKPVRKALCKAAGRGVRVTLYIDQSNAERNNVRALDDCPDSTPIAAENTTIVKKGKGPYGAPGSHLQHLKLFLVSDFATPIPLADVNSEDEYERNVTSRTRFTSSSGNLSSNGTSLHFENWIFFNARTDDYLAQAHLCVFKALAATGPEARKEFASEYAFCREQISAPPRTDFEFLVTPHDNRNPEPIVAMTDMIQSAEEELLVAIHRLTTGKIYNELAQRAEGGVDVGVIYDDDVLRTGVVDGGPSPISGVVGRQGKQNARRSGSGHCLCGNSCNPRLGLPSPAAQQVYRR